MQVRGQALRAMVRGSRIKDQGSRIKDASVGCVVCVVRAVCVVCDCACCVARWLCFVCCVCLDDLYVRSHFGSNYYVWHQSYVHVLPIEPSCPSLCRACSMAPKLGPMLPLKRMRSASFETGWATASTASSSALAKKAVAKKASTQGAAARCEENGGGGEVGAETSGSKAKANPQAPAKDLHRKVDVLLQAAAGEEAAVVRRGLSAKHGHQRQSIHRRQGRAQHRRRGRQAMHRRQGQAQQRRLRQQRRQGRAKRR